MKEIPLTQGYFAIIDDDDYERLKQLKWHVYKSGNTFYAQHCYQEAGKFKSVLMHRMILDLKRGDKKQTDHIDHNGLNNLRSNLRTCTNQQNSFNQNSQKGALSRYVGVSYSKKYNKYIVLFWHEGKHIWLGWFDDEIEAAKTRDLAALKYRGRFAKLNFPKQGLP